MNRPEPREETPLVLRGVSKRFGDFAANTDVNLSIEPGEIFALLGPNGAGKTTLISCITGLARQTAGEISVFGYDTVKEFRTTRRLVGLVPQEINFDPFFTPHESLLIQMGLMGVRRDPKWADQLLDRMSLLDRRTAYTRNLSGGMKRRLLIAKALVHRPRLLFLDEPTAGVDVELRKDLWNQVEELRAQGTTIILTTHYLEEAERLADRIGVIHRGRIVLVEERETLLRKYGSSRVQLRLAEPLNDQPETDLPWEQTGPTEITAPYDKPHELACLIGVLSEQNRVTDIQVRRSSLEDIFVDLIQSAEQEAS